MNIKNLFSLIIIVFLETHLRCPTGRFTGTPVIHPTLLSLPTLQTEEEYRNNPEINFKPEIKFNVIETNYIIPPHTYELLEAIKMLIDGSDKVIFFMDTLDIAEIIEKLIQKTKSNDKFISEIFIGGTYNDLDTLWKSFQALNMEEKLDQKTLINNFRIYVINFFPTHYNRIVFYKEEKIIATMDGSLPFTSYSLIKSTGLISLKNYPGNDSMRKIQTEVQRIKNILLLENSKQPREMLDISKLWLKYITR